MSRFVEELIAKAGLGPVLAAHRSGDLEAVRASIASWSAVDLLVLGAVVDVVRAEDIGQTVHVHPDDARHERTGLAEVTWVEPVKGASELDLLRAVAVARIAASNGARIGIDWSQCGIPICRPMLGTA